MSNVVEQQEVDLSEDEFIQEPDAIEQESQEEEEIVNEVQEAEVPSKFKDKPLEDIVKSYAELEKEFGRKNNELGELRKLTDQLLGLQLSDKKEEEAPKEYSLDVDSLLDNPSEAISSAISNNPEFREIKEALQRDKREKAKAAFEAEHANWEEDLKSQEFQEWVGSSSIRSEMFQRAHTQYDYKIAGELFDMYNQTKPSAPKTDTQKVKRNAVETGSTGAKSTKIFRRADLINLRTQNPAKYEAMEDEIMKAYAEKRVR